MINRAKLLLLVGYALLTGTASCGGSPLVTADEGLGEDPVKMGLWTKTVFRAVWRSDQANQNGYLQSKTGLAFISVGYNSTVTKEVTYRVKVLENFYYQNRYLISESNMTLLSDTQTVIHDTNQAALMLKVKEFILDGDEFTCDFDNEFKLMNRKGDPLPINTPNTDDIIIKATVKSKNCKIDFSVDFEPNRPDRLQALIFIVIECIITLAIGWPFLKGARQDSVENCHFLNLDVLLMSIGIDYGMLFTNMLLGNQVLIGYSEIFLILSFFKVLNCFSKLRAYIQLSEFRLRVEDRNANANQLMFTLVKMFVLIFLIGTSVRILLVNYWLWLIVFLYPWIQVYYNCFYEKRKNAFGWRTHFLFFMGQISYLLMLHGWDESFFGMPANYWFCGALAGTVALPVFVMYLQWRCGVAFFLPESMKQHMRVYKKTPVGAVFEGKDCSICLLSLALGLQEGNQGKLIEQVIETPCGHLFHNPCLKEWMDNKMSCPVCRTNLPPDLED